MMPTTDVLDNNENGRSVARAILKGTARAISDGSFKDQLGTPSTVIYGDDETNRMISVNAVHSVPPSEGEDLLQYLPATELPRW